MREILRTVAQCHSRTVIMRDVKPDNFLFLNSNEHSGLRAIDFGLAEYCEPGQYLTDRVRRQEAHRAVACSTMHAFRSRPATVHFSLSFGMCMHTDTHADGAPIVQAGTVIYISPEVLRNKYTLSADLWSVGIMAYILLTGDRLLEAGRTL